MRRIIVNTGLLVVLLGLFSCEEKVFEANFEDIEDMTIYNYLLENDSLYGNFLKILEAAGIDKTLSAYNPEGAGYTLFLPDSFAVEEFINERPEYNTLSDLLDDKDYVTVLARYHVVRLGIDANDFPFGALPEYTMSDDLLTINFVIEIDTSYYKINNQAQVIIQNIELSNGFIHVIKQTLEPITYTSYDWIKGNSGLSIFTAAVEATGFDEVLSRNIKDEESIANPVTLLVEHDSIYHRNNIFSLEDLVAHISPDDAEYTKTTNKLNGFVGYHILDANQFLDDFEGESTNYTTFSEVPLAVNGKGLDILINLGKFTFDTIISGGDTTIIDYLKFNYDASNVITQSGPLHFIDQLLEQQKPSQAQVNFEFWEEPLLNEFRLEPGEYLVEDPSSLYHITWTGPDLVFVKSADTDHPAWSNDFLFLNGDFSISYTVPKVVQGTYTVLLRADAFNPLNAIVEVFIDGKKLGSLVDLTDIGDAGSPFQDIELGTIDFGNYEQHTVTVRSLIPGRFSWDLIRFSPFTN